MPFTSNRAPRIRRFLASRSNSIPAPAALVPAEHFAGTELSRNRFSFYGEAIELTGDIDWDINPGSPHWGHDLNRFGFLILYDEKNSRESLMMENLILDWIQKNDRPRYQYTPYAWQNLLNIAIRIENWWRFLAERSQSEASDLDADVRAMIRSSVLRQVFMLLRLIRKLGFGSNWALIGLRSALYILFSDNTFPHRERLIQIAWRDLRNAIDQQVLPDGVQQELSPHYHWVVLEIIWSIDAMAKYAGRPEQGQLSATIVSMADFLNALILPDEGIVSLGDSDFEYGPRICSFLSEIDPNKKTEIAGNSVQTYPYAGVAVVRNADAGHILVFDAGPLGTAHQHEDALSFWLTAYGEHFLIDPGRYLYDHRPDSMYSYLCSSSAHSTILVDGEGQNAKRHMNRWRRSAAGMPIVEYEGDIIRLFGRYCNGYGRASLDIVHERTIVCDLNNATWAIHDRLVGEGEHFVEARFQFAPCAWSKNDTSVLIQRGCAALRIEYSDNWDAIVILEGSHSPLGGWFSPGLNKLVPAPCLSLQGRFTLPFDTTTVMRATVVERD